MTPLQNFFSGDPVVRRLLARKHSRKYFMARLSKETVVGEAHAQSMVRLADAMVKKPFSGPEKHLVKCPNPGNFMSDASQNQTPRQVKIKARTQSKTRRLQPPGRDPQKSHGVLNPLNRRFSIARQLRKGGYVPVDFDYIVDEASEPLTPDQWRYLEQMADDHADACRENFCK